jgi:hypothetical protein
MDTPTLTLDRAARVGGYLALGFVGTALLAVGVQVLTFPLQPAAYRVLYLHLGPVAATETATLTHVLASGAVAISVPTVVADYLDTGLANRSAFARALVALGGVLVAFLAASVVGLAALPTAALLLLAALVAVPVALRYRYGVRSGGVAAFVGGAPVPLVLLLLAGVGLGWGWGYTLTATAVPGTAPTDAPSFDDVPAVRDDLFAPSNCERTTDDRRRCDLELRAYDHESTAVRFLARNGVRCPYANTPGAPPADAFVARHDGVAYEVSCAPHGD